MPDKLNVTLKTGPANEAPVALALMEFGERGVDLKLGEATIADLSRKGLRLWRGIPHDLAARAGIPIDTEGRVVLAGREEGEGDIAIPETRELRKALSITTSLTWGEAIDRVKALVAENARLNEEPAIPQGVRAALKARIAELEHARDVLADKNVTLTSENECLRAAEKPWQEGMWEWLKKQNCATDSPLISEDCPTLRSKVITCRCNICNENAWLAYCEAIRYLREAERTRLRDSDEPTSSLPKQPSEA